MIDRIALEEREYAMLSSGAAKASESMGRDLWEEPCQVRTAYMRDRDR
ncbi:MAG: deoxyguanosinetriphosphate triphosphohydrolase, partial [Clostridia bacterium]|nr:deoxyguanosinetriphosphate triphosphohydrolase [Clostridia bacterium]